MVKGPCLCGDPYCGSCGDPSLLAEEVAIDKLMDTMSNSGATIDHYTILIAIAPVLIKAVNDAVDSVVRDRMAGDQQYISHLKDRIFELQGEVTPDIED